MKSCVSNNLPRGTVFILSAPAGTGKTTLVTMLTEKCPRIEKSISCTTRSPRPGEVDGKDYHFLTKEQFLQKIEEGDFLEHAEVFGNLYGTSKKTIEDTIRKGKHVFLVIDTQGALALQEQGLEAVYIFLFPPDLRTLQERLLTRKTENATDCSERLSRAEEEIACAGRYDYHVVNEDLQFAYDVLKSIVVAEEHRVKKQHP